LTEDEKTKITAENRKHFKKFQESTINFLMSRTRLDPKTSSKHHEKYYKIIEKMFQDIHQLDYIQPILKVVENSFDLEIVFDFNNPRVAELDANCSKNDRGITNILTGSILVAASNYEEELDEIRGTLAHELTHYAMEMIYGMKF
jgi:hypothetical protein